MDVEVTPDTVAVPPDQAFLDDPATTYPVHVDPSHTCTTCGKTHHVVVRSPWSDARNSDATTGMLSDLKSDLKAGYVNGDELRSRVRMNTGEHIESATVKAPRWAAGPTDARATPEPRPAAGRRTGMGTGGWWVVLEENQGTGEREWTLSHSQAVGERESARAEALRLAREHVPAHPWFLRDRRVLRVSPDAYLVIATGRTSTFHFRVLVAELVE